MQQVEVICMKNAYSVITWDVASDFIPWRILTRMIMMMMMMMIKGMMSDHYY